MTQKIKKVAVIGTGPKQQPVYPSPKVTPCGIRYTSYVGEV